MKNNENAGLHYIRFANDKTALHEFDFDNEYYSKKKSLENADNAKKEFYDSYVNKLPEIYAKTQKDELRWICEAAKRVDKYHKVEAYRCIELKELRVMVDTYYKDDREDVTTYALVYRSQKIKDKRLAEFTKCVAENAGRNANMQRDMMRKKYWWEDWKKTTE